VSSENNPANLISRGLLPEQLIDTTLWKGSSWLKKTLVQWPRSIVQLPTEVPEMRAQSFNLFNVNSLNIFDRYSSLIKLKRVTTCRRFKTNCVASKT